MASKLKRSIHNQLASPPSPTRRLENSTEEKPSKELILRKLDLLPVLSEVLAQCRPHSMLITTLDVSFSIATFHILNLLCEELVSLQIISAKSCGLLDTLPSSVVAWPRNLRDLDLSRNQLRECPRGITELVYLSKLNLSGNRIESVPSELLRLPLLKKCLLLSNPIHNIPKHICREGVEKMRSFLGVEPLPTPQDAVQEVGTRHDESSKRARKKSTSSTNVSNCNDLRRFVLRNQSSFESGYESNHRRPSCSSTSSMSTGDAESSETSDIESDAATGVGWPVFHSSKLPEGYVESGKSQLCQVYLPEDCRAELEINEVRDLSLHPQLKDNELLITPVVRITPHGLRFGGNPAIIVLPHCTLNRLSQPVNLVALCSDTMQYQTPEWTNLESEGDYHPLQCEIFEDCVMFATFHFSLFAIVACFPYPSSSVEVGPGVGGILLVPELPSFSVRVPTDSIRPSSGSIHIRGTVYYCDKSYRASDRLAPASACIGVEPHGLEFFNAVQISVPIPDYTAIKLHFPDAKLELWCSEALHDHADIPTDWKQVDEICFHTEKVEGEDTEVATFVTDHFSWYEVLWTLCSSPLQMLGLGAASVYNQLACRSRYIAVRFQAFMSRPSGTPSSFGLVVTVYKFGEPLSTPSNYPLLVADSGSKRLHLRTGDLYVRIEGCFLASHDLSEVLERNGKILDFTGEDFCERFEFALNLKVGVAVPLPEGHVLGKLRFIQWEESNPIHKSYNLIMVSSCQGEGGCCDSI